MASSQDPMDDVWGDDPSPHEEWKHPKTGEVFSRRDAEGLEVFFLQQLHPSDYVKTEHWREFRADWHAAHPEAGCVACGERPVDLHHPVRDFQGCEDFEDVVPLCRQHHDETHDVIRERRHGISREYAHGVVIASCRERREQERVGQEEEFAKRVEIASKMNTSLPRSKAERRLLERLYRSRRERYGHSET